MTRSSSPIDTQREPDNLPDPERRIKMKLPTLFSHWKRKALTTALVAVSFAISSTHADDDVIVWRLQTHNPQSSWTYKHDTVAFAERLHERTGGRLKLEVHPAGSLFPTKEIFNAVQRGIIPIGTVTPGYITNRSELAGIAFGLPNSFHNVWEAAHFFFNKGFEQAFRDDLLEKHGIYWATSVFFPTEMVVKKPIESVEDLKSSKIRSSGILQKFLTESGASAAMIPGEEIYQALATGVVDGAHWGAVTGAASLNLYEVAKYHVRPPISIASNGIMINKKAMDKLPPDIREILISTLNEHVWTTTAHNEIDESIMLRNVQAQHGVKLIHLPESVRTAMNKAALKSWSQEAERGDMAARQIETMKALLSELGYL
jgi:TRAP-type C4-dicarboxylate transport system substrate-binding protein